MAELGDKGSVRPKITHVLFDMDGLLLDTESFYTDVQQQILARFGKKFDWDLKAKMMGKKALEAAQVLVAELGLEGQLTPEDFVTEREQVLHKLFPGCQLMPGAERLVRHLHAHGVPIAVATSSHKRHFDLKITNHGELFGLMHHIITGDHPDVKHGKPAPDIFLVCAAAFDEKPSPAPESILVFEDAPSGVQAAVAAKMNVVMVPDENLNRSLCAGANQILPSLLMFDPSSWGLPPFEASSLNEEST